MDITSTLHTFDAICRALKHNQYDPVANSEARRLFLDEIRNRIHDDSITDANLKTYVALCRVSQFDSTTSVPRYVITAKSPLEAILVWLRVDGQSLDFIIHRVINGGYTHDRIELSDGKYQIQMCVDAVIANILGDYKEIPCIIELGEGAVITT